MSRSKSAPAAIPTAIASGVSDVRARMRSVSCSSNRAGGWLAHDQAEIPMPSGLAPGETAIRFHL